MQCPYCGDTLLDMPVFDKGYGVTYYFCLPCYRHYTLDGYEVLEPAAFWTVGPHEKTSPELQWIQRWLNAQEHPYYTDQEWRTWFREEWLPGHEEGPI